MQIIQEKVAGDVRLLIDKVQDLIQQGGEQWFIVHSAVESVIRHRDQLKLVGYTPHPDEKIVNTAFAALRLCGFDLKKDCADCKEYEALYQKAKNYARDRIQDDTSHSVSRRT